jgi:hypothetical protein
MIFTHVEEEGSDRRHLAKTQIRLAKVKLRLTDVKKYTNFGENMQGVAALVDRFWTRAGLQITRTIYMDSAKNPEWPDWSAQSAHQKEDQHDDQDHTE